MITQDTVKQIVSSSPNRRGLLRKLGIAAAAASAGGFKVNAQASTPSAVDILQFTLNIEYLENEHYSVATTGETLEQRGYDVSGTGSAGPTTTSYGKVSFANNLVFTSAVVQDIAANEVAHILLLRQALLSNGVTPIAKPAINLDAMAPMGASLANEATFLVLSRMFEDVGTSLYSGSAVYLANSPYLRMAARILAIEAEHVSNIRSQMARLSITTPAIDAADVIPPPAGSNFFSSNLNNGLCATRTPGEALYLVFGNVANATQGGFFPNGVNGAIHMSTGPATAANLDT